MPETDPTEPQAHGPIDYLLVEFPAGRVDTETVDAVLALVDRRVVFLYDVMVLTKGTDGSVTVLDLEGLDPTELGGVAALAGARSGLLGDDDVADAGAALDPGVTGLLLVYENAWAIPFVAAALRSGGQLVAGQRIPAQAVMDALDAADAAG